MSSKAITRGCKAAALEVIYLPNPLLPASQRIVKRVLGTGSDTIDSLVRRLALQATPLEATLNGRSVPRRRWKRSRVHTTDVLVLRQAVMGTGVGEAAGAAALAAGKTAATAAAIQFAVTVAVNLAIGLALSFVAQALFGPKRATAATARNDPSNYSLEGGGNQVRPYSPLMVVLGEHQVFPDYASRPWSENVPDPSTTHLVVNNTPRYESKTAIPFVWDAVSGAPEAPWVELMPPDGFGYGYYGDGQERQYERVGGTVTQPHTFVTRFNPSIPDERITPYDAYINWQNGGETLGPVPTWYSPGTYRDIVIGYGYYETFNSERLCSIFSVGFGDLEVTNLRIGATTIDQYSAWSRHDSFVPPGQYDRTRLTGYTTDGWVGDDFPTNVQVAEGGKLEQHEGVDNEGWIERRSSGAGCNYVQFDIAGRLFRSAGGGIETLTCDFGAQFRQVGAADWTDFPFPVSVSSGSTTPVRQTFRHFLPESAHYDVRVRRTTPDPTEANDISELELSRIKFFRIDPSLYPGQRRVALLIRASGQLSGRLDRLSAFVRAKHWIWDSAAPWTPGVFPDDAAAPWTWGHTTNPAWLFLYYARGGFLNSTVTPGYLGGGQGWLDRPDPTNGARLFGAGLSNNRIDYAAIVAWGHFCQANNLECRMVITEQMSTGEILDIIAGAGRASKTWATGKLGVVWEAPGQPTVGSFGMGNIIAGSFQISYDTDESIDEYVLGFTNSDTDYSADTVYAAVPGVPQPVNQKSSNAQYAMPASQAQRQLNLAAASKCFHRRRIIWQSGWEAALVQRGDVVALAHDLTQWAHSGRLVALVAEEGLIRRVSLSCSVENSTGNARFYIWVRRPNNTWLSVECTPPAGRSHDLDVVSEWPVDDAPGVLDMTLASKNLASTFPKSVPEDWTLFAGPTATPGKRVRIMGMEPAERGRVRFTARDEYDEYYPLEHGWEVPPAIPADDGLVARAFNLALDSGPAGGYVLVWELENAYGAEVSVSANHGPFEQVPISGSITVAGRELLLPPYPAGTQLSIHVLPKAAGTPVAIEGGTLEVTV
ncbi:MAG: hypothetical protein ABS43_03545 [Bordetella sp. SCN 67-23]|nr:hypothetical protein [Burkholderiales bacterium]ODS75876.1 MAG: hypothetical protein ABS43_03545 [Bordetella sp. SCN 67-23]OJW91752.1 MAG: hypothetical protein BGO71_21575 [Burkholderiales bacterium 67-32]